MMFDRGLFCFGLPPLIFLVELHQNNNKMHTFSSTNLALIFSILRFIG